MALNYIVDWVASVLNKVRTATDFGLKGNTKLTVKNQAVMLSVMKSNKEPRR